MSTVAEQSTEASRGNQGGEPQKVVGGAYGERPAVKMLYVHLYVDAYTRDRDCCLCKKQLDPKGIRYKCRKCNKVSLCEDCAENDAKPGHHRSKGQRIDLSRVFRPRTSIKQPSYSLSEEEQALIEPTDENQKYMKQVVHRLRLREDFCPGCFDVSPSNVNGNWCPPLQLRVSDLRVSAEAGCATCSIAHRGLLIAASGRVTESDGVKWHIQKEQIKLSHLDDRFQLDKSREYLLRANPGHANLWETLRYAPLQTANLGSEDSFAVMRSWIERCETNHQHAQCTRPGAAFLPRRVVYIHPDGYADQRPPVLSLLEPPLGAQAKYIALSHCWGTEPVLRTNSTNYSQLCAKIEYFDLPLTFRDAIRCAQGLGVAYLWIDSLCIIQDDLQDWDEESAKMGLIYHDAYLVIAAGASTSDQGGLLYERPSLIQGKPLESKEGSGVFDLLVQQEVPHADGLFPAAMDRSPITSRAWCMQELILARRSISFFREEMIWECHSYLDCECGKVAASSPATILDNHSLKTMWVGRENPSFGNSFSVFYKWKPYTPFANFDMILSEWRHLTVPAYSARALSKPQDRLPAAAGMAALIARLYDQDYLAGIWRKDLKHGLMWSVLPSEQLTPTPADYIAPSFSWASLNRAVVYKCPVPNVYEMVIKGGQVRGGFEVAYGLVLVEANVKPSGVNPLGCVDVGSYIRLWGLSMRFTLRLNDGKYSLSHPEEAGKVRGSDGSLVFHPDCALEEVFPQDVEDYHAGSVRPTKSVNRSKMALDGGVLDDFVTGVDALVLTDVREVHGAWDNDGCTFIVLGQSQSNGDSYERLGLGVWRFGDDKILGQWIKHAVRREFKII